MTKRKPDENTLFAAFVQRTNPRHELLHLSQDQSMPYKRARYLVRDKWVNKGWVDYGVSWRCAFLLSGGKEEAERRGLTVSDTHTCQSISSANLAGHE